MRFNLTSAEPPRFSANQRGFGLLEAIAAIAVLGFVTLMASRYADQATEDQRAAVTAQHMVTVAAAAKAYLKANFASVGAVSTPTVPATIPVSALINTGFLPAGFSEVNNRGSTVCVQVLAPAPGKLDAMVVATGGSALDDLTLGQVVSLMGAAGGGVYQATAPSTQITGATGGWSVPAAGYATDCAGAPTTLTGRPAYALWFDQNGTETSTLYRDSVPGRPDLNQMNTPILMASVQTLGDPCTATGAIARDTTGKVVSCQSGTWKAQGGSEYWGDPVANFAGLPACNGTISGQTRVALAPLVGTGARAYTCDGTAWQALAVDDNGDLAVANNLTVAKKAALNTLSGRVQLDDSMIQVAGTPCAGGLADNGRLGKDATGLILSCQNGIWKTGTGDFIASMPSGMRVAAYPSTSWSGNNFSCPAGLILEWQHYDCGCSNNASWATCRKP